MNKEKFYLTHIEIINIRKDKLLNDETYGLFSSYREASMYILEKDFECYAEQCGFTEEWDLIFYSDDYKEQEFEVEQAYIEELKVIA